MPEIQSFVFLDLETTGFPWQEGNQTKITELAMLSVNRNTLLNTNLGNIPRVLQKLVLCFNPTRPINSVVTGITGMSNRLLEKEVPFDKTTVTVINEFLSRQPAPVCLLVHNGNRFDYPILKAEIAHTKKRFAKDLMCADSLIMFKDLLGNAPPVKQISVNGNSLGNAPLVQQIFANGNSLENAPSVKQIPAIENKMIEGLLPKDWDSDVDPSALAEIDDLEIKYSSSSELENTPEKCKFPKRNPGPFNSPNTTILRTPESQRVRKSFKLKDIYEFLIGSEPLDAHRAENDCLILLECCIAKAKQIVEWCDVNCVPFSEMPRMEINKKFPAFNTKKRFFS